MLNLFPHLPNRKFFEYSYGLIAVLLFTFDFKNYIFFFVFVFLSFLLLLYIFLDLYIILIEAQEKWKILMTDPKTTRTVGKLAIAGTKLAFGTAFKAGPLVLKVCGLCIGIAAGVSSLVQYTTGLSPAKDAADVARGAQTFPEAVKKYENLFRVK